jgi:cytochrome c1
MKTKQLVSCSFILAGLMFFVACTGNKKNENTVAAKPSENLAFGGYASDTLYGKHLVDILDCATCHTPKKMTDHGPVLDMDRVFSGHPADLQLPPVDRSVPEKFGAMMSDGDMTAFMGPWGVSFAGNLTPHATGIGNWSEETFINAIRYHKYKGNKNGRDLMPPMPVFPGITDGELKAIYAFLRTVKPVENIVPAALPPVTAMVK